MLRALRHLPVRAKLGLVVGVIVIALLAQVVLSLFALERLRVGGPTYRTIRAYRDGIERIAILQSDLNAYQAAVLAMAHVRERDLVGQADRRRKEIAARVEAGFDEAINAAPDGQTRVGLESARATWREFLTSSEREVLPAAARGDADGFWRLTMGVQQRRYARFIEQVGTAVNRDRLEATGMEELAEGDARRRVRELAAIATAVALFAVALASLVTRSITRPLGGLTAAAGKVARGTIPATVIALDARDELGQLADVFDAMLGAIRDLFGRAKGASRRIEESSRELLAANRQMAEGAKEQSTQLGAVSDDATKMAAALHELAATADGVAASAGENAMAAEQGAAAVAESALSLEEIRTSSAQVREALGAVTGSAERIETVVEALQDIATETHVLSLNASLEASRAGEAGRGFATVAAEVRSLADRAARSAREIKGLVPAIAAQLRAAQQAVDGNVAAADRGTANGGVVVRTFEAITRSAQGTRTAVGEMTAVLREQVESTRRTAGVVHAVSGVAAESLAATTQMVELAASLQDVVHGLDELLARFELEEAPRGRGAPPEPRPAPLPDITSTPV